MAKVMTEWYCRECTHEEVVDDGVWIDKCPKCGSEDLYRSSFVNCEHCGEKVYLTGFTTECYGCGKPYNGFGQELAPVAEWDEEDRYGCYGPQNDPDY